MKLSLIHICLRAKAGSKPLRQRGGSTQMLSYSLFSSVFGNMRKKNHIHLQNFV